jgi:membrane protein
VSEKPAPSKPSFSARIWAVADRWSTHPEGSESEGKLRLTVPVYTLRVLLQVARKWARDRCPQQASSLAFQTALSLVPMLAVGLALLRAFGATGTESTLVDWLAGQVLPVSRSEISRHLIDWAHKMSDGTQGAIGVIAIVILGFLTASSVESIFNDVWRAERSRSLTQKFMVFYALITIIPLLMGVSIFHLARIGLTSGFFGSMAALGATFLSLTFAYKLLPATRVEWRAAAAGAVVAAVAFEAAKHLFALYVAEIAFKSYAGTYGAIALIPLLLVWIYYTWLVILFGCELSYAIQHLPELELYDRRAVRLETEVLDRVNGLVAVRFMVAVVDGWRDGVPLSREQLGRKFHLQPETTERVIRRLLEKKLIMELDGEPPAFVPGRPPGEITLADIFGPFRGNDVLTPVVRAASNQAVDVALTAIEDERTARLARIHLDELSKAGRSKPSP